MPVAPTFRQLAAAATLLCCLQLSPAAACLIACALHDHTTHQAHDPHHAHSGPTHEPGTDRTNRPDCHGGAMGDLTPSLQAPSVAAPSRLGTEPVALAAYTTPGGPPAPLVPSSTRLTPEPPPPRA